MASRLADRLGIAEVSLTERIKALLRKYGLPTEFAGGGDGAETFARAAANDKKSGAGKITFVLPVRAGEVRLTPFDIADLQKIFALAAE